MALSRATRSLMLVATLGIGPDPFCFSKTYSSGDGSRPTLNAFDRTAWVALIVPIILGFFISAGSVSQSSQTISVIGSSEVQPIGQPMSHSTQSGLSCFPLAIDFFSLFGIFKACICSKFPVPPHKCFALGVGYLEVTVFHNPAPLPVFGFIPLRSVAVGVGHSLLHRTWSHRRICRVCPDGLFPFPLAISSRCLRAIVPPAPASGVRHKPHPVTFVLGSSLGSG